jgi:hypothetical protein
MNLLRRWIEEFHRSARNLTRWRRHPPPAQSLDKITFFKLQNRIDLVLPALAGKHTALRKNN